MPTDILSVLLPLLYFGIIILLTWLVAKLASLLIGRIMNRRMPLLAIQARRLGWALVWLVGAVFAIQQLGVSSDILLLMVGLSGVAAIVALRAPLENFGAKYFSDVYVPFKVGDSISVKDYSGKVVEVNSMSTILLSNDDQLISIPNSALVREVVINSTPQAWKEVSIPIAIDNGVDLAEFESAVLKSCNKLRLHLDRRFPPVLSIKTRGAQSTELSLTVMIRRPEQRDSIVNEINRRISETITTMQSAKR